MKEMYGDQSGEFVCGYWGLKGHTSWLEELILPGQDSKKLFLTEVPILWVVKENWEKV